jgi:hypothetical protein
MRKVLLLAATAIFLYSPYAPSWGKFVANAVIVGSLFSFYAKAVPKGPYW